MCRWHSVCTPKAVSDDSFREMSASKAICEKLRPPVTGLVNHSEVGCSSLSAVGLLIEPGQLSLYDTPSKSPSVSSQPPIFTFREADAGRQKTSSPIGSGPRLSPSLVSAPSGLRHVPSGSVPTLAQYSKCPISSEKAML